MDEHVLLDILREHPLTSGGGTKWAQWTKFTPYVKTSPFMFDVPKINS